MTKWIVHRLGNNASINDLILEICETRGLTWIESEAIVLRVQKDKEHTIAGRRFPVLFILALGTFLVGLAMVIYHSYLLGSFMNTNLSAILEGLNSVTYGQIIYEVAFGPIAGILFGACMMLGSLAGMRSAWSPLLDHLLEKRELHGKKGL